MIKPLPPYPAAIVGKSGAKTLVVADLHIGWELALSESGIHVPTQMPKLLERLKNLILTFDPDKLLILGDVKHTIATAELSEWRDVPEFFNGLKDHVKEIQVIKGNHDGNLEQLLPENVRVLPSAGAIVDGVGFFHGHGWPSASLLKCRTLVMGHVHPVVVLRDPTGFRITKQVWVKADCDGAKLAETLLRKRRVKFKGSPHETLLKLHGIELKTSQLFVMPSFNDFLGGRPLNEWGRRKGLKDVEFAGPLLRAEAVNVEGADVYLTDGTFLGTLKQFRAQFKHKVYR